MRGHAHIHRLRLSAVTLGLLVISISFLGAHAGSARAAADAPACGTGTSTATSESIIVPFRLGTHGVSTTNCYQGRVVVTVSGTGQADGRAYSDAFYVYTDGSGNPITPIHYGPPQYYDTWELWINGGPSDYYVQPIPAYKTDHVYTFTMVAPGGALNFAIGDGGRGDNTGFYTVTVRQV